MEKETLTTRKKIAFSLIVVLIVLAADIGLAQIAKFGFNWFEQERSSEKDSFRIASSIYHHGFTANTTAMATWGETVLPFFTNSLAFRDSEVREVPLKPEGARVLIIGDSFTEGVGVRFEDTFAGVIRDELGKQNIDVLNAAVVSYSPAIYFAKTKHLIETVGLEFDTLAVFIDMSDIIDEANFYVIGDMGHVAESRMVYGKDASVASKSFLGHVKSFAKNNSVTGHTFSVLRGHARRSAAYADLRSEREKTLALGSHRGRWAYDDTAYEAHGKRGLENAALSMERLLKLTRKHDIPLTVAVYPWTDQIDQHDIECKQVTFWRDWTGARDVPFINLFPALVNDEPAEEVLKKYFITGDVHWNAAGHRAIADAFLAEFVPPHPK